uniref:Uncharacterized protein n=1 Tax=Equus asinus TaxID=9793 RepID=A0A9L0IF29_EQUAS
MVLEVVTGKKVERWSQGGWRLEEGESPSLFYPNTIAARDRSEGLPAVLSGKFRSPRFIAFKWLPLKIIYQSGIFWDGMS